MTPQWVLRPVVEAIHDQQLAEHGDAGTIYPFRIQHKQGSIVISHTLSGSTMPLVRSS